MNAFDLPRRRAARRGNLVPVPDPHQPAEPAQSRFEDPHGIATEETLAAIAAKAEADAEQARTAAQAWQSADPVATSYPAVAATEETRARMAAQAQARAAGEDWYGHDLTAMDTPPARTRPFALAPPAAPAAPPAITLPPVPVTAAECASRMARLAYPPPDSDRDRYAAVMRQVSAYTGTRSSFDFPAAWASARPGPAEAPVYYWTPQRAPRLAIEAGSAVTA